MLIPESVRRLVDAQWSVVRAYQSLDEAVAAALYRDELAAQQDRARTTIDRLTPWPGLPPKAERAFTRGPDLARLRRILDLVGTGDRVLEIGTGQGYMAGVLLRDRALSHYCGVDINPRLIEAVASMAEVNGFDLSPHHIEVCDLFDLTSEFVAEHDPHLVLLLEVVEHVEDPAAALRVVSSTLGDDSVLVFSVPLLGRIEACWGHLSLFDDQRIRALCEQAGMLIQHVEVVQNQWVLIVCSKSVIDPERLAGLASPTDEPAAEAPDPESYILRRAPLHADDDELTVVKGTPPARAVTVADARVGVTVSVEGGRGGVRLATPDAGVVRLELSFGPGSGTIAVWVRQHDADGRSVAAWRWRIDGDDLHDEFRTYVFRPGVRTRAFEPAGAQRPAPVATTEIVLETKSGTTATMTVQRAASAGTVGRLAAAAPLRKILASTDRRSGVEKLVGRGGPRVERFARTVADLLPESIKRRLR